MRDAQQRDARDRRWSNLLCEIADAFMEQGSVQHAIDCWRLADSVAAGFTLDDMLRRIYAEPFVKFINEEIRLCASLFSR